MAIASGPSIWARKSTDELIAETSEEGHALKKAVGALDLTAFGVGAIIGTGIFVVLAEGIGDSGPAIVVSFVLAGLTCLFSALSYAELASSIPVSGSAYTYSYATLGELVAWIIGWDLILEYGVSVAAVAVGWGANLNKFLDLTFGFALPTAIAVSPSDGGVFNIPAVVIVLSITYLWSSAFARARARTRSWWASSSRSSRSSSWSRRRSSPAITSRRSTPRARAAS